MTLAERLTLIAERMEAAPHAARAASVRFSDGFNDDRMRLAFEAGCLGGAVQDYASDLRALINELTKEQTK